MEQIVVKTEVQPNGDILLFYVDENEGNVSTDTKMENDPQDEVQELDESEFVLTNAEGSIEDFSSLQNLQTNEINEEWKEEDIEKLLVFYIDNKDNFTSNGALKKHLWTVACKTMLYDKNASLCEAEFNNLKQKYTEIYKIKQQGAIVNWPFYDMCHQAFHDDYFIQMFMEESKRQKNLVIQQLKSKKDGIFVMKKDGSGRSSTDKKVELMLNLYLKYKDSYKKSNSFRSIWDTIALEVGEEDADYWHKRFLNFKQHYIRMVYKRYEGESEKINWPYMRLFDKIFEDDEEFKTKYLKKQNPCDNVQNLEEENNFNETERTVLVKYYIDCFHEFQDPSIPNKFLWHEIGRLIDKKPESCKQKYKEMKMEHVNTLMKGDYDLANRIPTAIILDNIIARETEIEFTKSQKIFDQYENWSNREIDELVQFLYDNIECFKDTVCYYVCWYIIAKKLKRDIHCCKRQWQDLTTLYKTILEDKKENPDMQINWKYIDLFDRIFDYGMDANLLEGYENVKVRTMKELSDKVGVKKVNIKDEINETYSEDEESYDERGFMKRSKRHTGDSKAFKILDYFLKNKDKFSCSLRKKLSLWEILAKQLGITAYQCAHRFRNLKQVYIGYVQREINKPDMPILWPYYALCKKVFGYRAIKSKLKNGKMDSDEADDWVAREIKQLINYFSNNYEELHNNVEDLSRWTDLSRAIGKTEGACSEKFLELRKSYRKLKTMKARNPEVKVSWKYFNMLDDIFVTRQSEQEKNLTEEIEISDVCEEMNVDDIKTEIVEDDDFQYIIVIPEDQDISENIDIQDMIQDNEDSKVIEDTSQTKPQVTTWNRKTKKLLLLYYFKYLLSHKGKEIDSREMWKEISSKLMKSPLSCRKILIKLKNQHRLSSSDEGFKTKSPYYKLIEKILQLKPKFAKIGKDKSLQEKKTYKDVAMSDEKVEEALQYYLENLEEFFSPKFEKKYVWIELANFIKEPVSKVFNKINYLKKSFSTESSEMPFGPIIQEITAKETLLKDLLLSDEKPVVNEGSLEEFWTDDEIEQLLTWYLNHLDKFKNPKYVRSYLWMEAAEILKKSPLICSKRMSEIRTQYRNMVKEAPEELKDWRFFDLCQKIYGTGKKPTNVT